MSQHREIKVPPLGESVSEATVARWVKNAGDAVKVDELLVELETDKVTLEVTAPASGVLYEIMKPVGTTVEAGQILGKIAMGEVVEDAAKAFSAPSPSAPTKEQAIVEVIIEEKPKDEVVEVIVAQENTGLQTTVTEFMAPSARKLAVENQIDPQNLQGTGKDGRITKGDVLEYMQNKKEIVQPVPPTPVDVRPVSDMPSAPVSTPVPQPAPVATTASQGARAQERVRMTRLRQRIAERLKYAQNTAAILTTFNEIDMSAVFNMRKKFKDAFEKKHGVRLGFMSFFVKAAVQALKEVPVVNAEIDGEDIIYKNYYDIGVAVSAPQGLVVPVIRDADKKSFADLEKEIAHLGQKARDGKLTIEEMQGGTFTISNGGVFGSLMATPILNPPQTGILGMHKVEDRPVAIDGKVEIRPMMYVALSYDHRLIDGRESVTFLVRVKEYVENPERLLLEI